MRKERESRIRENAKKAYSGLCCTQVHHNSDGTSAWLLRQLHTTNYRTEVRTLSFGRLLVHGDSPLVVFSGYAGNSSGILEWAGCSSLDYISSKVIAPDRFEFDAGIAKDDLSDIIAIVEDPAAPDSGYDKEWVTTAKRVYEHFLLEPTEQHLHQLLEGVAGAEELSAAGQVIHSSIIWAQMLLRRLMELDTGCVDLFGNHR